VLALNTRICSPRARAAFGTSRSVASAIGAFAGLTRTTIRTALGSRSCRRPNRLVTTSVLKVLTPVALPAGPGKTGDQSQFDRAAADAEGDWDRRGRGFGRLGTSGKGGRADHVPTTTH